MQARCSTEQKPDDQSENQPVLQADAQSDPDPKQQPAKPKTLWQLIKYGSVSFTQTFVELGVFTLLRMALPFAAANAVAVTCSATYQFLMNRNLTFKSSSNITRSAMLFVLMWIWNFAFSTFAIHALSGAGWDASLVKLITMGCQAIWGFLLSKYVIFK